MHDLATAKPKIEKILRSIFAATRLEVEFTIQDCPGAVPDLTVEFTGDDIRFLTARNAELLKALEHIACKIRGLDSDQHDFLSFDADHFKFNRDQGLLVSAHRAASSVRETRTPYAFPPMSSHERRQLHLTLNAMGLTTASTGEGAERRLVLYPPLAAFDHNEAR